VVAAAIANGLMTGESLTLTPDRRETTIAHRRSRAMAVATIDLGRVGDVVARLDGLLQASPSPAQLLGAFATAGAQGWDHRVGAVVSVELADVAETLARVPALHGSAVALREAIGRAVVDLRQDLPAASAGLTIFPPFSTGRATIYQQAALLSPRWRAFVQQIAGLANADEAPPVVRQRPATDAVDVTDETAILAVDEWRTRRTGPGETFVVVGAAPARLLAGTLGQRQVAARPGPWDGRGWWLCDGPCAGAAHRVAVPTFTERAVSPDHVVYSASVNLREVGADGNGEDGVLFFETDHDAVIDHWIAATEQDTNDNVLFTRDQYRLRPGLTVAFYQREVDPAGPHRHVMTDEMTLHQAVGWQRAPLGAPGTLSRRLAAYDLAAHVGVSRALAARDR
jgi:hypothetical protein